MCGRYSVLTEDEIIEIRAMLHDMSLRLVRDDFADYEAPPGEIVPTLQSPVVTKNKDGMAFEYATFGFKKWDGKGMIINAKSETLRKPGNYFTAKYNLGRAFVPAREYYEWQNPDALDDDAADNSLKPPKKKAKKIKHRVADKDGNLLFFAALTHETGNGLEFIIVTKEPAGEIADKKIHNRMPVILRMDQLEPWLTGALTYTDVISMDFNASAYPCIENSVGERECAEEQLSMFRDDE